MKLWINWARFNFLTICIYLTRAICVGNDPCFNRLCLFIFMRLQPKATVMEMHVCICMQFKRFDADCASMDRPEM